MGEIDEITDVHRPPHIFGRSYNVKSDNCWCLPDPNSIPRVY